MPRPTWGIHLACIEKMTKTDLLGHQRVEASAAKSFGGMLGARADWFQNMGLAKWMQLTRCRRAFGGLANCRCAAVAADRRAGAGACTGVGVGVSLGA